MYGINISWYQWVISVRKTEMTASVQRLWRIPAHDNTQENANEKTKRYDSAMSFMPEYNENWPQFQIPIGPRISSFYENVVSDTVKHFD